MRPLDVLALVALSAANRYPNDFSPYPTAAQPCLNAADKNSGCDGSSVRAMNGCLCANTSDFIPSAARCISRESPDDLEATYATLKVNCDGSNTPMTITEAEFLQLQKETQDDGEEGGKEGGKEGGEGGSEERPQSGGLATGAKIGIAVSAVAAVGLVSAGIVAWRGLAKDKSEALQETLAENEESQVAELE